MKTSLSVNLCGIKFKNPIVVASATPTKDAKYMRRCVEAGAGGVISKTISPEPLLTKYVSPRFTVLHKKGWPQIYSNYSCEFLATYSVEDWMNELKLARKYCDEGNSILIGSISGNSMQTWSELAKQVEAIGVDMLELNFGCPHPRDLGYKSGQELGSDPNAAAEVTKIVVDSVKIPVFIKLTAEAVSPVFVAQRVKEAGAHGVTVINRFPALDVDIDTGRPLLHSTFAGVGGPWMRPITLKWIAKVAREVGLPISATNGINSWQDMIKCTMVGASTIQTCTALMYGTKQYGHIQEFLDGMEKYLTDKGLNSLDDIRGITLPKIKTWDVVDRETKAISIVDADKCTGCGFCPTWCFYDAVTMYEQSDNKRKANINPEKCDGCGLCASLCPKNAIRMEGPKQVFLGDFS